MVEVKPPGPVQLKVYPVPPMGVISIAPFGVTQFVLGVVDATVKEIVGVISPTLGLNTSIQPEKRSVMDKLYAPDSNPLISSDVELNPLGPVQL